MKQNSKISAIKIVIELYNWTLQFTKKYINAPRILELYLLIFINENINNIFGSDRWYSQKNIQYKKRNL